MSIYPAEHRQRDRMATLRTVSGVITTFVTLIFGLFFGSIIFSRVIGALDTSGLSGDWLDLFNANITLFGMCMNVYVFLLAFCIGVPIMWIFVGNKGQGVDRV